jgi:hypothetical protein
MYRLKKRNEDALNAKLALNMERDIKIKSVRDKSLKQKNERIERLQYEREKLDKYRKETVSY